MAHNNGMIPHSGAEMAHGSGFKLMSGADVIGFVPHRPEHPEKSEGGKRFILHSDYQPAGDQPEAIKELVKGMSEE